MAARKGMSAVVRRICLWCQGKSWMRVRECEQVSCPLHACRLLEDGDESALLECIREFCLDCAGSPQAVEECTADRPMGGQPACPAHPFRTGDGAVAFRQSPASQQVRLLPGLGEHCVRAGRQSEGPDASSSGASAADAPLLHAAVKDACAPVAAPLSRQVALPITHAERVPEAPDI